ncbi:MAG: hypothetical protein EOO06_12715 [Chitinophagaceae bacterium]|nr:MAG: hypothetical protein EOO06_12715 [Chitinophagaceae bacterium]
MKKLLFLSFLLAFFAGNHSLQAQNFDSPVEYMGFISKQHENISKKYMAYSSASAHGKKARKVEAIRQKLLNEVQEARMNISGMPAFKGDKSYRDTSVSFMKLYYNILNDDYNKILNLEEIAENSYDEMEAMLNVKDAIDQKLEDGNKRVKDAQANFAKANMVNLVEGEASALGEKLKKVHALNKYYNEVYLVFFKPYIQEQSLVTAMGKNNVTGIEQSKNALKKYAEEGIEKLKTIKPYEGDNSVTAACKTLLQFYIKEADASSAASEYTLAKENFEKMKKDFEKKSSPTKAEVDAYNKSVVDINKASQKYNQTTNDLNRQRSESLNNWNKTVSQFFDEHTPRYK